MKEIVYNVPRNHGLVCLTVHKGEQYVLWAWGENLRNRFVVGRLVEELGDFYKLPENGEIEKKEIGRTENIIKITNGQFVRFEEIPEKLREEVLKYH